jgi:hypothetical protein
VDRPVFFDGWFCYQPNMIEHCEGNHKIAEVLNVKQKQTACHGLPRSSSFSANSIYFKQY